MENQDKIDLKNFKPPKGFYYSKNKESIKKYQQAHMDKVKEANKKYLSKPEVKERRRQYYLNKRFNKVLDPELSETSSINK